MKKPTLTNARLSSEDRFGRQIAARLDASLPDLPHDISERLRVARLQAMEKYKPALALAPARSTVVVGGGLAALGRGGDESPFWTRWASLVPLLALIAALFAFQALDNDDVAEELADIDTAILTDDLPPAAYTDPGFAEFLKSRLSSLNSN
jgi:hypothetical protein